MKKLIAIAGAALVSVSAFGQGTLSFQNVGTGFVTARVTDAAGNPIAAGASITIELLAGTSAASIVPFASAITTSTWVGNGYFNVGAPEVVLPGFASGSFPFFQLRAWNNTGGVNTYAAALAAGQAYLPSSSWQLVPGGGLNGLGNPSSVPPVPGPALYGMAPYQLIVPEPSVIALGVLGAAALLLRRRK